MDSNAYMPSTVHQQRLNTSSSQHNTQQGKEIIHIPTRKHKSPYSVLLVATKYLRNQHKYNIIFPMVN